MCRTSSWRGWVRPGSRPVGTELTAAFLTPPGPGGVSVLAVDGPGAAAFVAARLEGAGQRPTPPGDGRLLFGLLVTPTGPLDEVVLAVRGPDEVELGLHGGDATRRAVEAWLRDEGIPLVDGRRSELPGETRAALESARGVRALAVALAAHEGALERRIANLAEQVAEGAEGAADALNRLLTDSDLGLRLLHPPQVVLLGAPNAGKSTLANALVEHERFIATAEPGTTRDLVTEPLEIDGWPFVLTDAAGWRADAAGVEGEGIARLETVVEQADVVIGVLRVDDLAGARAPGLWERLGERCSFWVWSQVDRLGPDASPPSLPDLAGVPLATAAIDGLGIRELRAAIIDASPFGAATPPGDAPCFTVRQVGHLRRARDLLTTDQGAAARELRAILEETP